MTSEEAWIEGDDESRVYVNRWLAQPQGTIDNTPHSITTSVTGMRSGPPLLGRVSGRSRSRSFYNEFQK